MTLKFVRRKPLDVPKIVVNVVILLFCVVIHVYA